MTVLLIAGIVTGVATLWDMVRYCIGILKTPCNDFYEDGESGK